MLYWGFQNFEQDFSHSLCLFDLIPYVPVNNLSAMSGQVFLGRTSTKQGLMCHAQERNAVTPVRLKPAALQSRVKHSITEPLCSLSPLVTTSETSPYLRVLA